ncbi:hypothetical protein B0H19DRAFT_1373408 [Mycena capillaripes]|nr:hypothetical protein B0H19DRAFT_1373408 [Mycena capillaripes]
MPITLLQAPPLPASSAQRAQFRPILHDEDTNGISAADFQDLMMQETNLLGETPEAKNFLVNNTEALRREIEILQLQHLEAEFEGADDETVPQLAQEIRDNDMLQADGEDEDNINQHFTGVPTTHDYAPYGNKTMCYLDILDNLPRLRLSSSQLKMILWIMNACGAKDVPSFNAFRAMQKHIRKTTGVRSEPHKSDLGNFFYVNDIRDLIAKDFANPEVAPHIQKYPEDVAGGPISEIWQLKEGKWHDTPLDALTPSILVGYDRYYIHEVAELSDGQWAIPALWIVSKGKTYADCRLVTKDPVNFEVLAVQPVITRIPLEELRFNQEALERRLRTKIFFHETCQEYSARIPNRFREIDNGEDLFTVWVPVWADDVSGARSKQYQKHLNVYTANANLPGQLLQQEYFVRFVSTSPHAGALEQLKVTVNHVKSTHRTPVRTYNAATARPCGFRLNVPDGPADNPQQAEEASHIGHQGLYFCRRCLVGGTIQEKECPDGYHSFYEPGRPRNVQDIRSCVLSQLRLATYGVASHVEALQTSTGTKDKIAQHWIEILIPKAREMQTASSDRSADDISNALLIWLSEQTEQPYNPLLDLPFFDPSQDTLVEILHTILLGNAKYTWYELHHNWTTAQQDILTVRLQGTNLDGLRVPPVRAAYMMQYRNGLIGKHFKTLMQTMIFHIHDIVTPEQFSLVRALGELGPLLWMPVIDNMDEYLVGDLQILIDNLLDAFATLDPTKILIKLKLHVLLHIVQDIRRRGPAVRFSTEVFECFNAIFRLCSVLSNHQAPSRDIAAKFADLDRVKHILSGGYWFEESESAWVCAGKDVRRILRNIPIIQRHLGWAPPPFWTPGLIKAVAQKKQSKLAALTPEQAMLAGAVNPMSVPIDSSSSWTDGVNVAARTGDCCTVGSWAVFRVNDLPMIARISKILLPKGGKSAQGILVITKYNVGEALHPHYHMPVLLPDGAASRVVVASDSIQFSFNVQHDCRASGCDASGVTRQMQERQESDTLIHTIVHKDDVRFIINMHGFHNAGLLRKYLPIALTKPRPLFPHRRQRHDELAAVLAVTQKQKRAATQEKAAATREKNKAAKAGGAGTLMTENIESSGAEGRDSAGAQKRPRVE